MQPPLTAIYCRVSTGLQQNSLEGQDQRCLDYAKLKGLSSAPGLIFADAKVSGRKPIRERPDGAKLMQVLTHGAPGTGGVAAFPTPVKHLVVAKLDRLGRKAGDLLAVWDFCKQHEITIHIVDMCGDSITSGSSLGRMMYGMLALFAEFEREMIVERVQQTVDQLFASGRVAGTIPYGFDEAPAPDPRSENPDPVRRLVPNAEEQIWLLKMAEWRFKDPRAWLADPNSTAVRLAYNKIAAELNTRSVPTKAGKLGGWQSGNVAKILNSRTTREFLEQHYQRLAAAASS